MPYIMYRTGLDIVRSGGIAPCILNLSTRWRWVVNFTTWLL